MFWGDLKYIPFPLPGPCRPASPALCQDLPLLPPSAPIAEPPSREPGSSSISPAPAPWLRTRRPQRAQDPGDPLSSLVFRARRHRPGAPLHPLRSPLQGRERGAVSPRSARGAAAPALRAPPPPLPALHSRRLPRSGGYAGSSRSLRARGPSTAHFSRNPRPPPTPTLLTSRPAQGALRSPAAAASPATSGPASAAEAAAAPAQALEPPPQQTFSEPGSRYFPARHAQRARPQREGARARGREGARAQGSEPKAGTRHRRAGALGGGASAAPGRGGQATEPRPLQPGRARPLALRRVPRVQA